MGKMKESLWNVPPMPEQTAVQAIDQYLKNYEAAQRASVDDTLEQRGNRYGDYRHVSGLSQELKTVMQRSENWYKLEPFMQESLHMIANKLARILSGDPYYDDSWHDIAGYATLVVKQLDKK